MVFISILTRLSLFFYTLKTGTVPGGGGGGRGNGFCLRLKDGMILHVLSSSMREGSAQPCLFSRKAQARKSARAERIRGGGGRGVGSRGPLSVRGNHVKEEDKVGGL